MFCVLKSISEKNFLTADSSAFKGLIMLLCICQMLAEATRSPVAAGVSPRRGHKETRGSQSSFATVAPAHNLDWLGPGS
jgi:hypothetical protein